MGRYLDMAGKVPRQTQPLGQHSSVACLVQNVGEGSGDIGKTEKVVKVPTYTVANTDGEQSELSEQSPWLARMVNRAVHLGYAMASAEDAAQDERDRRVVWYRTRRFAGYWIAQHDEQPVSTADLEACASKAGLLPLSDANKDGFVRRYVERATDGLGWSLGEFLQHYIAHETNGGRGWVSAAPQDTIAKMCRCREGWHLWVPPERKDKTTTKPAAATEMKGEFAEPFAGNYHTPVQRDAIRNRIRRYVEALPDEERLLIRERLVRRAGPVVAPAPCLATPKAGPSEAAHRFTKPALNPRKHGKYSTF